MANYYLDFVGLNTFIYEANTFDGGSVKEPHTNGFSIFKQKNQNQIGWGFYDDHAASPPATQLIGFVKLSFLSRAS